jgi:hypothetical protein
MNTFTINERKTLLENLKYSKYKRIMDLWESPNKSSRPYPPSSPYHPSSTIITVGLWHTPPKKIGPWEKKYNACDMKMKPKVINTNISPCHAHIIYEGGSKNYAGSALFGLVPKPESLPMPKFLKE